MKKFLFLIGVLYAMMQFIPQAEATASEPLLRMHAEIIKEKNDDADMHHRIEAINKELKSCNFLTPRRTAQSVINTTPTYRILPETVRTAQYIRLRGANRLQKVSENVSRQQAINHSALLTRMGYRVYALREIII